jgi:diadenosine tetraphosphatase ApaH/serine/threonine PP2A family protein phosphatase
LLDALPDHQATVLPDGTSLLGVHASPGSDDGPGFDSTSSDDEIARLLADVATDWVVGGHTHDPTDRLVAGRRVLNPGSVGLPRTSGAASWLLVTADGTGGTGTGTGGTGGTASAERRRVGFDTAAVVDALHRRRHPNRDFIGAVLCGTTFLGAR